MFYRIFTTFSATAVENIIYYDVLACLASFAVIFFGSLLFGVMFGLFAGLVSQLTHHVSIIGPLSIFVFGYTSFLFAEMCHLSGILSYVAVIAVFCYHIKHIMI